MHFSLRLANGEPASYHPDGPGYLSPAGSAFVAGVFRHLAALTRLGGACARLLFTSWNGALELWLRLDRSAKPRGGHAHLSARPR